MMKKFLYAFFALMWATAAQANVPCSLPFNLLNGTTADATQVMANYNAIITCLTNAAIAGANNDITALNALSTPLSRVQGGSPVYIGGTSTGSANAQAVTIAAPTGFSLVTGNTVVFKAGFSNTGPLTLAVAATPATPTTVAQIVGTPAALIGSEVQNGQIVVAVFDGTNWQILNPSPAPQPGRVLVASGPVLNSDNHGKVLLGGGVFFTLTLNAPGTYSDSGFWTDVTNTDTVAAKLISVSGGTNFYLYAGQTRRMMLDGPAGAVWASNPSSQRWAKQNIQLFADPGGSDAND